MTRHSIPLSLLSTPHGSPEPRRLFDEIRFEGAHKEWISRLWTRPFSTTAQSTRIFESMSVAPRSQYVVSSDGARIYAEAHGNPSNPALVLTSGYTLNYICFEKQLALSKALYLVSSSCFIALIMLPRLN